MSRISFSMMEAGYVPGDLGAFKKEGGKIKLYNEGAGGEQPTSQNVTQTTIPEYARPYVEKYLGKAEALADLGYQPFGGQRVAEFDPFQLQAQQNVANMSTAPQMGVATEMAGLAGLRAGNMGYDPSTFSTQNIRAPQLQNYQMGPAQQVAASPLQNYQMQTARTGFNPGMQYYQMGPAERVAGSQLQDFQMQAAQTGFRPDLQTFQMGGPERVAAQSFLRPGTAEAYMSPYQQAVTDVEKREATRASNIMKQQQQAQAVQQGAFGGSRSGIVEAERQRNLAQQMGDIQARGSQGAFSQAQQQFNAEQQAGLQAALANQQAGLTTGIQNLAAQLGVQQLGTQTGLQTALANLSNEQQANVQNLASKLQTQGLNADQALRAALANQQAGLTTGQQNLAAQLGVQQLGTQTGLQTALANLSSEQQANVQNLAANLQTQGLSSDQALRAALANQQAGLTTGQQNLAALLGVQQLGSGQSMQAQLANQQAGLETQRLGEQSRQFGANLGMQGIQQQLAAAGLLGNLGQAEFGQQKDIINALNAAGAQRQGLAQQELDLNYQDFMRQQQYPYQQLGFMFDALRGLPLGQYSQSNYMREPSIISQGAGAYLTGKGLNLFAKGGKVEQPAGLADLAIMKMGS